MIRVARGAWRVARSGISDGWLVVFLRQLANHVPGTVRAAVIHEKNLQVQLRIAPHSIDFSQEDLQAFFFVVYGNDDGNHL